VGVVWSWLSPVRRLGVIKPHAVQAEAVTFVGSFACHAEGVVVLERRRACRDVACGEVGWFLVGSFIRGLCISASVALTGRCAFPRESFA
jgi:hypothetical protein